MLLPQPKHLMEEVWKFCGFSMSALAPDLGSWEAGGNRRSEEVYTGSSGGVSKR